MVRHYALPYLRGTSIVWYGGSPVNNKFVNNFVNFENYAILISDSEST